VPGERIFDYAVLTCAPGACDVESYAAEGSLLRELGLNDP
jgi:hypothetical protein